MRIIAFTMPCAIDGEASLAEKAYVALEVRHVGVGVFAGQQIATGDLAAGQSEVKFSRRPPGAGRSR